MVVQDKLLIFDFLFIYFFPFQYVHLMLDLL